MKYYTAVKKECHRYTSVGEDLQDMLLTEKNRECKIEKKQKSVCVYMCVYMYTHTYI